MKIGEYNIQIGCDVNTYNCAMQTISGMTARCSTPTKPFVSLSVVDKELNDPVVQLEFLNELCVHIKTRSSSVFHDNIRTEKGGKWYQQFKYIMPLLERRQAELGIRVFKTPIFNNKVYGSGSNPGRVWTIISTEIFEPGAQISERAKIEIKTSVLGHNYGKKDRLYDLEEEDEKTLQSLVA